MKKAIVCCALLLFLFSGCKKFDKILHTDALVVNGCAIAAIHLPAGFDYEGAAARTATFSYNALGQPTSILLNDGGTGYPSKYLFRYDAKNRLTDFIAAYDNDAFDTWHIYRYNSNGLIAEDSVFTFGYLYGGPPSETDEDELAYNTYYTYDEEGRIRRAINDHYPVDAEQGEYPYLDTVAYTYNSDGNMAGPGITYDDKINMNRTNKVWMFINRNYSRNNFRAAVRYNEKGLPLEFTAGTIPFFLFAFSDDPSSEKVANVKIDYTCNNN